MQRLSEGLNMKALICGQDFALGKNREGDLETLTNLGSKNTVIRSSART